MPDDNNLTPQNGAAPTEAPQKTLARDRRGCLRRPGRWRRRGWTTGRLEPGDGQSSRPRDNWAASSPQIRQRSRVKQTATSRPSPDEEPLQAPDEPNAHPAPPDGSSSEAPAHWSAQDREDVAQGRRLNAGMGLAAAHRDGGRLSAARCRPPRQQPSSRKALAPVSKTRVIAGSLQQRGNVAR